KEKLFPSKNVREHSPPGMAMGRGGDGDGKFIFPSRREKLFPSKNVREYSPLGMAMEQGTERGWPPYPKKIGPSLPRVSFGAKF
ncbi:unnamed protein product, partial [Dovyalis caffra]